MKPVDSGRAAARRLALALLPGFLPLLVYVIAESVWGERIGLMVGIGVGIAEFAVILVRERRPDWLAAVDTILLAVMGGVSLVLDDAVFFRLKPAVLGFLLAGLVAFSAWGPRNLLMGRSLKAMAGQGLPADGAAPLMRRLLGWLAPLLGIHAGLTLVAALWWSEAAWLFVTGALFYVFMGLWFAGWLAWLVAARRRMRRSAEAARRAQGLNSPRSSDSIGP